MNNKKSLVALALVALVGIVGGTFAYFTSSTTLTNEFETGTYSTSVTEEFVSPDNWTPGTTTPKKVNVTNNGSVEVAVRAKYIEKWTAKNGTVLSGTRNGERVAQFTTGSDWELATDGYYYYKGTLTSGQTSSDFISSVTFNPNFELEEGTDIECTTTETSTGLTSSCTSLTTGYAGATYSLEITVETIQVDKKWSYTIKKEAGLYNGDEFISWNELIDSEVLFIEDGKLYSNLMGNISVMVGELVIPDDGTVTVISNLSGFSNLRNIVIPNKVNSIESRALSGIGMEKIVIPTSVTYIGDYAFESSYYDEFGNAIGLTILYEGTEEQWNSINLATNWDGGTSGYDDYNNKFSLNIIYNYQGN